MTANRQTRTPGLPTSVAPLSAISSARASSMVRLASGLHGICTISSFGPSSLSLRPVVSVGGPSAATLPPITSASTTPTTHERSCVISRSSGPRSPLSCCAASHIQRLPSAHTTSGRSLATCFAVALSSCSSGPTTPQSGMTATPTKRYADSPFGAARAPAPTSSPGNPWDRN